MNALTVASADTRTMLIAPRMAAMPNTRPALIRGSAGALAPSPPTRDEYVPFSLSQTPMPSRTVYSTPTATSQTKNIATPSTRDSFSTDHGSKRLTCRLARRGPRPGRLRALGRARWVDAEGMAAADGSPEGGVSAPPKRRGAALPVTTSRSAEAGCASAEADGSGLYSASSVASFTVASESPSLPTRCQGGLAGVPFEPAASGFSDGVTKSQSLPVPWGAVRSELTAPTAPSFLHPLQVLPGRHHWRRPRARPRCVRPREEWFLRRDSSAGPPSSAVLPCARRVPACG